MVDVNSGTCTSQQECSPNQFTILPPSTTLSSQITLPAITTAIPTVTPLPANKTYEWRQLNSSWILPTDAVAGGIDSPTKGSGLIYIGRVFRDGFYSPVNIVPGTQQIYSLYPTNPVQVNEVEVLAAYPLTVEWVLGAPSVVPPGAVTSGTSEVSGVSFYLGDRKSVV